MDRELQKISVQIHLLIALMEKGDIKGSIFGGKAVVNAYSIQVQRYQR